MEKSYKYLGYFLILLIPLAFAGFYKTYIVQFPHFDKKIDLFIHLHAFIASVWIFMLIVQPLLVLKKQLPLHRVIGKFSYVAFPLLILSFVPQMIKTVSSGETENLFFPLGSTVLLIVFYSLAIFNRKTSSLHMRYMIATSLVFLGPTIARIGTIYFGWSGSFTLSLHYIIIYLILIFLIRYDRINKKNYKPYVIIAICYVIHQTVYCFIFL